MTGFNRLIIEKPFGHDLASAQALARDLGGLYEEKHLLRMDHFLGSEVLAIWAVYMIYTVYMRSIKPICIIS